MLCQKCWQEEARVHFSLIGRNEAEELGYCLACAREEHLSWLLTWGYGSRTHRGEAPAAPEVLPRGSMAAEAAPITIVGAAVARCECGCRLVVGAQLPCEHHSHDLLTASGQFVEHLCHCGRELRIPVPTVFCAQCHSTQTRIILASVETCVWDEQRRRIVTVDHDLRGGRVTWGTFAILN
ncbi:MAG TPA: hypothetical protein PLE19_20120 [Planctomycetota bacterium]|nr:hypothetical protein [Planctomycetota bacterium]HRR82341.1 hypothetical protein [Planctomycetota bacterium]HRT94613.1 hypothetical protein [Planctomycetota bacterium]